MTPEFNAPVTSVSLDRQELSMPLSTANPQLKVLVDRYIDLNTPKPSLGAERRVLQAVMRIMNKSDPVIEDVADLLNMHPRTLQRRLASEGATFEGVRDNARRRLAEIYLANDVVPLAQVAQLLGYANQSVLTRSCQRWFGKTPLAMRQQFTAVGR